MSIIEDAEELFPPKPGGMVDTARKQKAAQAQDAATPATGETVADQGYNAIRTVVQAADTYSARTLNVGAGVTSILLPEDRNRKRATILVSTASATIVMSQNQGNAANGTGFTLPSAVPLVTEGKGILYVYNPGDSAVQVSVLAELYAPGV
jgi:hypothetical protein